MSEQTAKGATFREVFAIGEFRAFWAAQSLSVAGDRLALVAMALLVYDRTHSPLLTAAAYAAGFLPWVAGGVLFGGLADRWPRRTVMVTCDLARAVLVTVMIIPAVPIVVLVILLAVVTSLAPPFEAARSSLLPDLLDKHRYTVGLTVIQTTFSAAMVLGYAGGGAIVAGIGARPALAVDAATFGASAVLIRYGIRYRPAAAGQQRRSPRADIAAGIRLIATDRALRTLLLMGWLVAFYAAPEGIAAPLAHQLGAGAAAVGVILAAAALGRVIAAPLFVRIVPPARRVKLMGPLAVASCATLLLFLAQPSLAGVAVILAVSGCWGVYQIPANAEFMIRVPTSRRGQAFGVANSGIFAGQGLAFVLAGAAAQIISPTTVVAIAGGLGTVAGIALTLTWRRTPPPVKAAG